MLTLSDGTVVLAATDLSALLGCEHLTQQRLAIARGERGKPRPVDDAHAEFIHAAQPPYEATDTPCGSSSSGASASARGARPASMTGTTTATAATRTASRALLASDLMW
jgi:hypothetical protein